MSQHRSSASLTCLLPVYRQDNPMHFQTALMSVLHQTSPADEILVICDGPLTDEHERVLDKINAKSCLRVIRNKTNKGLAAALNLGLRHAKHNLVARMDADDISVLDRFEIQKKLFEDDPDLIILGGLIEESTEDRRYRLGTRWVPQTHKEILRYAKRRCPFNHMTVMFRREEILKLGGYVDFKSVGDDYFLWIQALLAGYKCGNLHSTLVLVRAGESLTNRRRGRTYWRAELEMLQKMRSVSFLNPVQYWYSVILRLLLRHLPVGFLDFCYKKILRR